jgi:hypothetical protein
VQERRLARGYTEPGRCTWINEEKDISMEKKTSLWVSDEKSLQTSH